MREEMSSLQGRELSSTSENITAASRSSLGATAQMRSLALRMQFALPSQEQCDRLRHAVQAAATRDVASMDLLRAAVCEFTVTMRTEGATPEAALIALKALVNADHGSLVAPHVSDWSGYIIRERISTWCIDQYFSETIA